MNNSQSASTKACEDSHKLVPISQALAMFPGRRPHISTVWRWGQKGVRGVKLEIVRVGGRAYVSLGAIDRFVSATSAGVTATGRRPNELPAQRRASIAAARAHLDSIGM